MKKVLIMIVSVFTMVLIFTEKSYAYSSIDFPIGSMTYVQGGSSDSFGIKLETDLSNYTDSDLYDLTLNFNDYYQNKTQVGYFISRSIVGFATLDWPQDFVYTLQVGDIIIIMEHELHIMRNNSIVKTFVYTELSGLFMFQNVVFDERYQDGYNDGYDSGFSNGYDSGEQSGYADGWDNGYNFGYDKGFSDGLSESDTTYNGVFGTIANGIFAPIALIFGIELLPNITVGMIILVPLIFGLIAFIVGGKKNDK